tara:strand:+ start:86 stop:271 length:186 start_codon:yes stop_codon:yes gene_type:complete
MMAKIYDGCSLIVFEPPFVPDEKSGPKRALIILFCSTLGLVLGILYILLSHFIKESKYKSD